MPRRVCPAISSRKCESAKRTHLKSLAMLAAVLLMAVPRVIAQSLDAATAQKMKDAAQQGLPVKVETQGNLNVQDNVSLEAVLLPARVCQEVFGKEISHNYAAVEVTISNRNHDAAMIVHSIFIDYSDWALSGLSTGTGTSSKANVLQPWQTGATKSQISSVEYRVARGQLLDRQPWTARNIVIRSLVAAGSIATAFTFVTTDMDIVRGAAAFAGTGVPAAQTLWPDGTVGQMNRISDVGFQVNKVIPKDSSDIVVAFFPIDRFLTPGLKKLFLKSPALFFAPGAMALDPEARQALEPLVRQLAGNQTKALLDSLPKDYIAGTTDNTAVKFLDKLSLNNVRVVVGGILTVDVNTVPASITSVTMDGGNDSADLLKAGDHLGVMQGSYLSGATPVVTTADGTQATVAAVAQESTPSQLRFKLTVPDGFKAQTINFKAVKKDKDGKELDSASFPVAIGGAASK